MAFNVWCRDATLDLWGRTVVRLLYPCQELTIALVLTLVSNPKTFYYLLMTIRWYVYTIKYVPISDIVIKATNFHLQLRYFTQDWRLRTPPITITTSLVKYTFKVLSCALALLKWHHVDYTFIIFDVKMALLAWGTVATACRHGSHWQSAERNLMIRGLHLKLMALNCMYITLLR